MDMREILLQDLLVMTGAFDKLGIRYSLYGGSALGALRDGGYCLAEDGTKDDDIDIMIPFEDFEKLEDAYRDKLFPDYLLLSGFKFYDTRYMVREAHGYWEDKPLAIDIFYSIPTSKEFKESRKAHAFARNLCNVCTMLVTRRTCDIQIELLKEYAHFMMSKGNEVTVSSATWFELPEYGLPIYADRKANFEGHEFSIMSNIESYLDHVYGNWRVRLATCDDHHSFEIIDKKFEG